MTTNQVAVQKEYTRDAVSGLLLLPVLLGLLAFGIILLARGGPVVGIPTIVLAFLLLKGLFMVEPNQARVLTLFGAYRGTVTATGLRWTNPFYARRTVSLRVRNFETQHLKVNDEDGNPIEIAAVVVWRVVDTAQALFQVDHYEDFVHVQSEAALRNLATHHPYDAHDGDRQSLRGHAGEIAVALQREIQDRLSQAGVDVIEARISHLAYAPEIAQAMLQRQQASAIIAARQKIVEGAVTMVEMALEQLSKRQVVDFDKDQKARMVANLLVVLCSDRAATPVINTSSGERS